MMTNIDSNLVSPKISASGEGNYVYYGYMTGKFS